MTIELDELAALQAEWHAQEDAQRASAQSLLLPEEFWSAREVLGHIRQAAYNRASAADVVFHAVLARVAASVSHTVKIPPIVESPAPLCYFVAVCAPPGVGKTSPANIASELIPAWDGVLDGLPVGSGEGLVECLFDLVKEEADDGKSITVKRQTRFNAYVLIDEGQALTALTSRSGSTTMATLRSIWSGAALGQTNASAERKRIVPAGQYTYGLVMAIQPALAGPLLDDVAAGTPQRFAWASAVDPTTPDDAPPWPGPLDWARPDAGALSKLTRSSRMGYETHLLPVADDIREEVRGHHLARRRGEVEADPYQARADLLRLKIAGLLGILDGRLEVAAADWELAGVVVDTSDAVRRHTQRVVDRVAAEREEATSGRLARRQVHAVTAVEADRLEKTAKNVTRLVRKSRTGIGFSDARRAMSSRQREIFAEAAQLAIDQGWITEVHEPGQGTEKRVLVPVEGER